jgi:hypothetical protein
MVLAEVLKEKESNSGTVCPPWETIPHGVVSLLAMLEFAARDYVELAYEFGSVIAIARKSVPQGTIDLSKSIGKLLEDVNRLGLLVTREALGAFFLEVTKMQPNSVKMQGLGDERTLYFTNAGLDNDRMCHHLEAIYSTLKAELRTTLFKVIPKEKAKYSDAVWLKGLELQSKFPTAFKELERGGTCFSLGQATASVFHSMRALECGLAALARPFNISTALENWNAIIEQIEKAVRAIGQQPRSQQKSDDEQFFGGATSHLYFVKNAWRNHVSHRLESYSDDEALKILMRTQEFTESLCARLQE